MWASPTRHGKIVRTVFTMASVQWAVKWWRDITNRLNSDNNSEWSDLSENLFVAFLLKHSYSGNGWEQIAKASIHEGVGWAALINCSPLLGDETAWSCEPWHLLIFPWPKREGKLNWGEGGLLVFGRLSQALLLVQGKEGRGILCLECRSGWRARSLCSELLIPSQHFVTLSHLFQGVYSFPVPTASLERSQFTWVQREIQRFRGGEIHPWLVCKTPQLSLEMMWSCHSWSLGRCWVRC